jgi:hypothetical protein
MFYLKPLNQKIFFNFKNHAAVNEEKDFSIIFQLMDGF